VKYHVTVPLLWMDFDRVKNPGEIHKSLRALFQVQSSIQSQTRKVPSCSKLQIILPTSHMRSGARDGGRGLEKSKGESKSRGLERSKSRGLERVVRGWWITQPSALRTYRSRGERVGFWGRVSCSTAGLENRDSWKARGVEMKNRQKEDQGTSGYKPGGSKRVEYGHVTRRGPGQE
jgi:hypothetical protein